MRFRIISAGLVIAMLFGAASDVWSGGKDRKGSRLAKEAPPAPSTPDLAAADDSGVNTDNITNQTNALTFSGTADPSITVKLFDGVTEIGSTTSAPGTGNWSIDVSLAAGSHSITAVANDGVEDSPASGALVVTVDTSSPAVSTIDLDASDDTGASSTDNITTQTTNLTISGITEPNASVELFDGAVSLGTVAANGAGLWSMNIPLAAGLHSITAVATDVAGNSAAASAALVITVDTTAPAAPSAPDLAAADDSGVSNSDNITGITTNLTFSGTSENNAIVELFNGASSLGTTTANGAGNWTIDINLPGGIYNITARASDAAGNTSGASAGLGVTILTAVNPPSTPDLASADDTGASNTDNITRNTTNLTFTGTSDANASIELFNGAVSLGTTTANGAGAWTVDLALAQGTYSITAVAEDAANNTSSPSGALALTVDTTPPSVSGAFFPADNASNAASNTSFIVNFNESVVVSTSSTSDDQVLLRRTSNNAAVITLENESGDIAIAGTQVTITNSGADLDLNEGYYVNIELHVFADLAGNDFAGIAGTTTWNFTTSAGASVTAGSGSACATTFGTVTNIVIAETSDNNIDGVASATRTIVLTLSDPDYRFNTAATITPSFTAGRDISSISVGTITSSSITINVTFEGGNPKNESDVITISGIQVTTGGSAATANIVKNGSSTLAIQGITNGSTVLATVSPGAASLAPNKISVFSIPPDAAIDEATDRFSTLAKPVILKGFNNALELPGTFSGNGVVFNSTQNAYTFNPQTTGVNPAIPITFTHTEVNKCPSTFTKDFEVFVSRISGLNSNYCSNANSVAMSVDPTYLTNTYGPGSYVVFQYWNEDLASPQNIPGTNNVFDPKDPIYTSSINVYGGAYIYFIPYNSLNIAQPRQFGAFVSITQAPNVSVLMPRDTYCENGSSVSISGSPSPKPSDTFAGLGIDNGNRTFDPKDVPNGSLNTTINITYNYTDPFTGCSNTATRPITVYSQPSTVNPGLIYLDDGFNTPAGNPPTTTACENQFFSVFKVNANPVYPTDFIYNWYGDAALTNLQNYQWAYFYPFNTNTSAVGTSSYYITQVVNGCESPGLEIRATVFDAPEVTLDDNKSICSTEDLVLSTLNPQFSGSATSAGSYWTASYNDGTMADGLFLDASVSPITPSGGSVLDAPYNQAVRYRPGTLDKKNQSVILTLFTNDPAGPCVRVAAMSFINISASPTADAGPDAVFCADNKMGISGTVDGANASTTISWSVAPVGGTITNPTAYFTEYVPTDAQKNTGATLTFTLTTNDPDGAGPCLAATDDMVLTINRESRINAGPDVAFCSDETILLTAAVPPGSAATSHTWSGGSNDFGDASALNTTYNLAPAEIGTAVTLTITSNDPDGGGPCLARTDDVSILIKTDPAPPQVRVPDPYCVTPGTTGATAPLQAFGDNIRWYDNNNESQGSLRGTGELFSSGVTTASDVIARFFVTQTKEGCESDLARDSIIVNPAPSPLFTMDNFCLGDTTLFDGSASTVTYNNGLSGSVDYWNWTFEPGDEANQPVGFTKDAQVNTITTRGTYEQPRHLFPRTGNYNPVLRVVTSDGCEHSIDAKTILSTAFGIRIGEVPVASLTYKKFCDGDDTDLFADAGPANSEPSLSFQWDFADPTSPDNTSTAENPTHRFSAMGNYPVELIITTPLECADTVTTLVPILPYVKTFPYLQDFENADHGWVDHAAVFAPENQGQNSWQWNTPNGAIINAAKSGTRAWFTRVDALGTYYNSERSILYGPCVDVTQLERPLLSFDFWNNTDDRNDGVYMEVAIPDGNGNLNWQVLGDLTSGIEWYNRGLILGLTEPAGSDVGQAVAQIGWSGSTPIDPDAGNGWVNARHSLDAFKTATKLQIRFVFGSNLENPPTSETTLDGFALDDFKLSSRNRKVLVENFTSQSMTDNNNAYINFQSTLDEEEVVKLEYHTSLQEVDPINELNKADPNARVGYYGLTNSDQSIPRAFVDGQSDGDFLGPIQNAVVWTDRLFRRRTLIDAPFNIQVSTTPTSEPGLLLIEATVEPLETVTSPFLSLHIVVVEKDVNGFMNVMRKMLPTAAGDLLPEVMTAGVPIVRTYQWYVDSEEIVLSDLGIIAFIQNQTTRTVMQAESELSPGNLPSIVTGVEDPAFARKVGVYPNPARSIVNVVLPHEAQKDMEVSLLDTFGRVVKTSEIQRGKDRTTIETSGYAGGVYFIEIQSANGLVRKKLMILHNE